MGGFMPLIEAFLAFALTMLALATAVSAVVGVWLRVFRWRAYGLRQSLETIYDTEIEPRLTEARRRSPDADERLNFIADMTFALNAQSGTQGREVRKRRIAELERTLRLPVSSGRLKRILLFFPRRFRHWRSLRFGIDYLPESQFQLRLDASSAGQMLGEHLGAEEWERMKNWLTGHFTEVGVIATEAFARRSRVRTVIAGLVLAFAVNIDSFDLLNTYMTDEDARRAVIAQQDEILRQEVQAGDASETTVWDVGQYGETVDSAIERIQQSIAAIESSQNSDAQSQRTLAQLKDALETVRGDLTAASEAADEIQTAISATQGIASALTKSFPIGWDGYPNCDSPVADLRCARISGDLADRKFTRESSMVDVVEAVAGLDSSGFVKWVIGVLLTGFMVGLGAPFWVQTVDRLLKLKGRVERGASGSQSAEDASIGRATGAPVRQTGPAAPAGRDGNVARAAADRAPAAQSASPRSTVTGSKARSAADSAIRSGHEPPSLNQRKS